MADNPIPMQVSASALASDALSRLHYEPLPQQTRVLAALCAFAAGSEGREVFVLNGYAGTGKTSVVGAVIAAMTAAKINVVVLAPTGRAAKVAAAHSGHQALTIHKRLFRGDSINPADTNFFLAPNRDRNTVFFVDEASLIGDSGRHSLLELLARHVYSAPGCRMVLVGDEAQLPPVGQRQSTAMNPERLRRIGLQPICHTLDIPVRQAAESGILHNATIVRQYLLSGISTATFSLDLENYSDVEIISSAELDEYLSSSYASVGKEETLVVTRSNRRANEFNRAIRNLVLGAEEPLQRGERVIISRNDYYWSRINRLRSFVANGDVAEVTWVGKMEKAHGRYFRDVELRLVSDNSTLGAKVMMRSLVAEGPAVPAAEMERLYNNVMLSMEGSLNEKISAAATDPYLNALQIKYAYCVTCHKSQGGQWKHIYIDMGGITHEAIGPDFYRWLYTAITRATEKVYLINPTVLRTDDDC